MREGGPSACHQLLKYYPIFHSQTNKEERELQTTVQYLFTATETAAAHSESMALTQHHPQAGPIKEKMSMGNSIY